jgi:hypothetical protein
MSRRCRELARRTKAAPRASDGLSRQASEYIDLDFPDEEPESVWQLRRNLAISGVSAHFLPSR